MLLLLLFALPTGAQEQASVERPEDAPTLEATTITAADTAACYPLTRPPVKRRAVSKGGAPCTSSPTVKLTVEGSACDGAPVRVSWQASDPAARVFLRDLACDLPASGATVLTARANMTLRAVATTCAIGPETAVAVPIEPAPVITNFSAEHAALAPFAFTTLSFSFEHGSFWSIEGAQPFRDPLAGPSPFGGSARVTFPALPAEPVLTVTGTCGAATMALPIARCTGEAPAVDIGEASGRVAVGQQQHWLFLAGTSITRWWIETENGTVTPSSGVRPSSGEIEVVYTPAQAGEATLTLYGDSPCGTKAASGPQTVWNCARPLIESFTAGKTSLATGESTTLSYLTQERHGEVGSLTSSLGNAIGGPSYPDFPRTQHPYTATHPGTDTVTLLVNTPCGPATATLQITIQ